MHAHPDQHAGAGRRGRIPARWRAAAAAVVVAAAAALSLAAGAVPASAAGGYPVTATISVGADPVGVAVDPAAGTVYVANSNDDTVSVIDEATGAVTATTPVGSAPFWVAADPASRTVYVTNNNDGTVSAISAVTSRVLGTIRVGTDPFGVAVNPAAGTVYVANSYDDTVSVIYAPTRAVIDTIPVGSDPYGVAVDPVTGTVYVTNFSADTVSVIDPATDTVTATIPVGSGPIGVAVDPAAGTVYVVNLGDDQGTVSVIDAATNAVTKTIAVGLLPQGVAVDPAAGTVYVANGSGTVSVIDAATSAVTATIPDGSGPVGVAVDPATHTVYVTNYNAGTVSVISPQAAQAIAFTSAPPASPVVGGTYSVSAAGGGSGNPVTLMIDASSASVCSISGPVVTFNAAGSCVIDANQTGDAGFLAAPQAQQTITAGRAAAALSWAAPAPVTYGTALGGAQLDATASVPGTFSYSPPAGTVLPAGTQTLTATFTPADPADYTGGAASTTITVSPAPLTAQVAGSQTYGGSPAFSVSGYSGLVNGDTAAAVAGGLADCATSLGSGAAPGTYPGTISGCSGLSSPDYAISYADAGVTVSPAALTVIASVGSMTYGGPPPPITASYTGFANGDSAASLTTAPACSTTATPASPVGSYPSSCSGAADPNYAIRYTPGLVTVAQAGTALAYTGPESVSAGAGLVPAAALSSPAGACQAGQPVTFTLDANPTTGTAGTYPLESATTSAGGTATGAPVSTSGWQAGAYTVTASYAGTGNCGPSTATAPLPVTTPGLAAEGAGSYPLAGGAVSFGFIVAQIPHTSRYQGAISLVSASGWRLAGTLSGYATSSATQGTLTGPGSLYWWDKTLNHGHGGWQLAKTGVAFTAGLTATAKTSPGSFGIQISYTPVPPQPATLPNSSPVTLKSGKIMMAG
jgi:YVTN family beta-propeller protein